MKQVNIHEAKTHLSRLIQDVLNGEEVVIARDNKPMVRLVLHESALPKRRPGRLPGLILSMSEDFDAPLDDFMEYMT
ncbi:MAG: type II toxin-antitoxin system Phd/YefM family antitoxin [Vulcanimicrobiota bacterium]